MFTFGDFSKKSQVTTDNENQSEGNYLSAMEIEPEGFQNSYDKKEICYFKVVDSVVIHYVHPNTGVENSMKFDSTIMEAERSNSDLIEGVYEGGLKIWECTYDIANYLCEQDKTLLSGKMVLDLGCGSGILGILAYKLQADIVHYQDYNEGVIKYLTIPNVEINNGETVLKKSKFWYGDWRSFNKINTLKYDVILTSETIYNPKNQKVLLLTLKTCLKPDGVIILGGKSYYFGVGGGIKQFLEVVDQDGALCYEHAWKSNEGVTREIIVMRFKQ